MSISKYISPNQCFCLTYAPFRNQAEFGKLAERTLNCLSQFKRVGDVELVLMYAFRNKVGTVESYWYGQRLCFGT